ncbi:hypothetical protein M0805_004096 [Coniferiporia weirii]|nr:hypothetical protein M0805_004096 [Coniferiporia weirii]
MPDDDGGPSSEQPTPAPAPTETGAQEQAPTPPAISTPVSSPFEDRRALLDHARVFLTSPHVVHEHPAAKRRFLAEKGLHDAEIETLMRELPPAVPPRTYPHPPPSNLPHLLAGLTRILTWLTGGSLVLVAIYYRFLLPRLTRSALARRSLKQHQASLLARLNASLVSLKSSQAETFAVLPAPTASREPPEFAQNSSLKDLDLIPDSAIEIPEFTLLRCAIQSLSAEGKKVTREELFSFLDEKYTWLRSEKGVEYKNSLWGTLTNDPCFSEVEENGRLVWTYTPASPSTTSTPLTDSLAALKSSLPPPRPQTSPYQHTLETLADFTGYITTQTYQLASSSMRISGFGLGMSTPLAPQHEEIRKEIRALKGLVLNRRTFAPATPRPTYPVPPAQTP